jgi:very-short-patch-repair endonuclease
MATRFEKLKEELAERNKERGTSYFENQVQALLRYCKIFNFVPEYQVDCYFIDIAFPSIKLALELDGRAYHSTPEQLEHDEKKKKYLIKTGWEVMRLPYSYFRNREMNTDFIMYKHLKYIWQKLYPNQKMSYGLAELGDVTQMLVVKSNDPFACMSETCDCDDAKTYRARYMHGNAEDNEYN